MSRIGIVTYHFVPNYGAALQAWSLQQFLQQEGHEVFFVDYRPTHLTTGGNFWWPSDSWRCHADLVIAYMKAMSMKRILLGDGSKNAKFSKFHRKYLNISGRQYRTEKELLRHPPEADAFICGSDQIWNASDQRGIDPVYFLSFVKSSAKRIAYAASFGRPMVHPRFRDETAEYIKRLDAISVREHSATDIVRDLTGREAEWLPDPTLLVNDGYPEAILPEAAQSDYLFSYTLRSRDLVAEVELRIMKNHSLEMISPSTLAKQKDGAPGPLEWLGYIKAAKFVVTNSYHGTLFSIIFRKPFIFVGLRGHKAGFNERASSLLKRLGLSDRMIFDFNQTQIDSIMTSAPDWNHAHATIDAWRDAARHYLCKSLSYSQ